jgi:hypothetical protein
VKGLVALNGVFDMSHPNYNPDDVLSLTQDREVAHTEKVPPPERYCAVCKELIPPERLEILPGAMTCVQHSQTKGYLGVGVFSHKTASELNLIDPNASNAEEVARQVDRAVRRAR